MSLVLGRAPTADASQHRSTPGRAVAAIIVAATCVRVAFAFGLGLGVDESYMVAAGRQLQLSYFDHPPLAWWLSWAAAHIAGSEAAIVVRMPFILLFALTTWLVARLAATLFGPRAGPWAAAALSLSPVFGVTTASWVLPDGPLDCALAAAALCLVHALQADRRAWGWWLAAGAAAGAALLSKYSAVLSIGGVLLYLLTQPRHRAWLRRPQPYAAAVVALLLFAPVLAWNAAHGWASFGFQGGRAEPAALHPFGPLVVLAGEALFVLPWLWAPMMLAWVRALRRGPADWPGWLLACLALPPIVGFAVVALGARHVLFHWAAPGYLMLFPLLGAAAANRPRRWTRGAAIATAGVVLAGLALTVVQVRAGVPPLAIFAHGRDPSLEAVDWMGLRPALRARGLLGHPLAATSWREAGKLAYAVGPNVPVVVLNRDARQFGIVAPAAARAGQDLLIVATGPVGAADLAAQSFAFTSLDELPSVELAAGGGRTIPLRLYDARGLRLLAGG